MVWISHSSSLILGEFSVKNLVRFGVVRYNSIFCCYLLKFSPLNFSGFFTSETDIGIVVGITGTYATIGVATWADAIGTTLLDSESIFLQICKKICQIFF